MPENPLLPNAKLHELRALLARTATRKPLRNEAILCATAMHLLPGDIALPSPGDDTAQQLAAIYTASPVSRAPRKPKPASPPEPPRADRFAVAAGLALGIRLAATDALALVHARMADAPTLGDWRAAFAFAQRRTLPLLFAVADTGKRATRHDFTYAAATREAARLQLPVLTVDGADAVAMYRVMGESVLRARQGGGPVLMWCVLDSAAATRSGNPLARIDRYLRARGLRG